MDLLESRAETKHLFAMISTMGTKLESQDYDINATLKVLRKNHLCLRGHDLASQADQQVKHMIMYLLFSLFKYAHCYSLSDY